MHSNILYQIKKQSYKKSSPFYQPNHQEEDIRKQLFKLRSVIRCQQTTIIRLNQTIRNLKDKILFYQTASKIPQIHNHQQKNISKLSKVPMILENTSLKETNEILTKQVYNINDKNNQLNIILRQNMSQNQRLRSKIKQYQIIEQMRRQRFQQELERMTPLVIQPLEYKVIKEALGEVLEFLRERVIQIVFDIFLISSKQCQNTKKMNSFTIFQGYWLQLKNNHAIGLKSVLSSCKIIKKLFILINPNYGQIHQQQYKDTMNEWIIHSIIDINNQITISKKKQQNKLFRLLALYYRSKFPLKNETYQLDHDVKIYLQDTIYQQIDSLLANN